MTQKERITKTTTEQVANSKIANPRSAPQAYNTGEHVKTPKADPLQKTIKDDQVRTKLVQEILNIGSWEWDIINNTLWWSREVYDMFGVSPEQSQLTYETFLSFVHPDDVNTVKQTVDHTLHQKKQFYSIEHRIVRTDNAQRNIRERAEVVYVNSKPIRMIGLLQDVTEERKKDDRLHRQELELRSRTQLLDLAHDTIMVHDLDGIIIFWNKGAEQTYGWTKKEAIGQNAHTLLKTEFTQPLLKIITTASAKGAWEGELTHTTKKGKKLTVESRWGLQKNDKGEPLAILEIDRDITKRKNAEKKSDEARRFSESVIQTIQEALIVLDAELKVITANNTFYELFDLSSQDTEQKHIFQLAQNQWDTPGLRKLLEDILPKNTSFNEYEMKYIFPEGQFKILLLNARRIYRKKEKTEMILLAMQDVTKLKQREQEIRNLTEQLLLAEEQQRQKIASALHDSIGQILAFSNRELASLQKQVDSKTAKTITRIRGELSKAVKQSRKLTADLSSPTLNTFGLEAGIEELADQFSEKHHIECRVEVYGQPEALPKNIELVFYYSARELLCNIAKHAQAENVHIHLKPKDSQLLLCIEDDGKGFDVSMLDQFTLEKNCFGLFSIQQRLTNLGGSFTIKSNKNNGTTVTLTVPLPIKKKG